MTKIITLFLVFIIMIFSNKSYALYERNHISQQNMVDNILLIGRDSTNNKESAKSDTMIILINL